jgi:hypothetical protein
MQSSPSTQFKFHFNATPTIYACVLQAVSFLEGFLYDSKWINVAENRNFSAVFAEVFPIEFQHYQSNALRETWEDPFYDIS